MSTFSRDDFEYEGDDGLRDRVIRCRKARGWSQGDLANAANVSQSAICHLEAGRSKTSRYLSALARALGVSVQWLESGKGRKQIDPVILMDAAARGLGDSQAPDVLQDVIRFLLTLDADKMERAQKMLAAAFGPPVESSCLNVPEGLAQ